MHVSQNSVLSSRKNAGGIVLLTARLQFHEAPACVQFEGKVLLSACLALTRLIMLLNHLIYSTVQEVHNKTNRN